MSQWQKQIRKVNIELWNFGAPVTESRDQSVTRRHKSRVTVSPLQQVPKSGRHAVTPSASKRSIRRIVITEKAPTRAFSWLKAATTAFTFKTLLRHYAKQALTPWSLNVKLGPRRNYHEGRVAIRHYANQTLRHGPNFTLRDRGVNARLA